jgi:hypothetical protein
VHTGFWWGNLRERGHLENKSIDETIILKWIFRNWNGEMDWIDLAQGRDRWWNFVKAVINFWVS